MRLRPLLIALFVSASMTALPAQAGQINGPQDCVGGPADPAEWNLAIEVVHVIIPPEGGGEMMRTIMDAMSSQMDQAFPMPTEDPELRAILKKKQGEIGERLMPVVEKHLPSISNAMACAYVREFSLAELQDIAAFSRTPAGKHYLSRSTALIADPSVAAANQAYFADIRPVAEAFFQDVAKAVSDYLAKKKKR